jgi:hypothetical protein
LLSLKNTWLVFSGAKITSVIAKHKRISRAR